MDKKLLGAIQDQVNAELYSSYLYFAMSSWLESQNLPGFANWTRVQAQEELFHATYMHDYLIRRGEASLMQAIACPPNEWADIEKVFAQVYEHEGKVTASINNISTLALEAKDHAAYQFFMQYVDEQVEEMEESGNWLAKIKMSQLKPEILFGLDKEAAARVYTQPFGAAK